MGACWLHGGTMRASKKKAERVKTERALAKVAGAVTIMTDPAEGDLNPVEVLLEFLRVSVARTRWLDKKLTTLDERKLYDLEGQVLARLDADERDRGARAARYCIESGVPAIRVRLETEQSELVARMIRGALIRIGAPSHYAELLGAALRVEELLEQQEEGVELDRDALAAAEAQLADVLAQHAEPVAEAEVVTGEPVPADEPRRVIIPDPPQDEPLTVPEGWEAER
jgi:hypothetical protein